MKILVALPGNLHTVRMNRFVPAALAESGHEVRVIDYTPTFLEKLLHKLARATAAEVVERRLLAGIEKSPPELFLALYGVNVSPRVLAELGARRGVGVKMGVKQP